MSWEIMKNNYSELKQQLVNETDRNCNINWKASINLELCVPQEKHSSDKIMSILN
jgi:hypothetical protein